MVEINYSKTSVDQILAMDAWLLEMAGSNNKAELCKFAETIIVGQYNTSIKFVNPEDELAFTLRFKL